MSELLNQANLRTGTGDAQRAAASAGKATLSAGSILAALASSACCILPLVLVMLGVSGAWIGNLTALAPYQWIFVALTLLFLAAGFVMVYRKPKTAACVEGSYCATPASDRVAKIGLWSATVLVVAALAFPYVAPMFL